MIAGLSLTGGNRISCGVAEFEDMQEMWQQALDNVRKNVRALDFRAWFKPLRPIRWEHGKSKLTIQVKDAQFQAWFVEHFQKTLEKALEAVTGGPVTIEYSLLDAELFDPPAKEEEKKASPSPFLETYTFDNFVVGPGNHMAFAASKAVAKRPGKAYNPLFIYGGTGLGKTHLLHAIGQAARGRNPKVRVLYISSETYMNDLITSIRLKTREQFRVKYRDMCDILLVDDIQFLSGKPGTQEEFFHTFNALHAAGKQIVFTSDRFPAEIPEIEARLRSRFEWGLTADMNLPDRDTRLAILKTKAQALQMDLPEDVAIYLAEQISDNVRELESCLHNLLFLNHTQHLPITVRLAQDKLKAYFKSKARRVTAEVIQSAVAQKFDLTPGDIVSSCRKKSLALPRHIAMYLTRRLTRASFPEIGEKFGGRDHSSVMSGIKKIESHIKFDTSLRDLIDELELKLRR